MDSNYKDQVYDPFKKDLNMSEKLKTTIKCTGCTFVWYTDELEQDGRCPNCGEKLI